MHYGLDFGTCNSQYAMMVGKEPIIDLNHPLGIPSIILYNPDDDREYYGLQISESGELRIKNSINYLKKTIRDNPNDFKKEIVINGGKKYTPEILLKKYIMYLTTQMKERMYSLSPGTDNEIREITLTVPLGLKSGKMMSTEYNSLLQKTVAEMGGIGEEHVHILEEPVAAALYYVYTNNDLISPEKENLRVMVFDMGGGTLDVTIVDYNRLHNKFETVSTQGDLDLGGNNFDEIIIEMAKDQGLLDNIKNDEYQDLKEKVVSLKEKLSIEQETTLKLIVNGSRRYFDLSRQEFEEKSNNLMDRAMAVVKATLSDANCNITDVDAVFLAGGAVNMPMVRSRFISEYPNYSKDNIMIDKPSAATAMGAAIYSKYKARSVAMRICNMNIVEKATHSYGFESIRSSTGDAGIYTLIEKGTVITNNKIALESRDSFTPLSDEQTHVRFVVYEIDVPKEEMDPHGWVNISSNTKPNGLEVTIPVPPQYIGNACDFVVKVWLSLTCDGILEIQVKDSEGRVLGKKSKMMQN